MKYPPMHIDELVEHWTILDEERDLIAGKRDATRIGFAILLKFYRGADQVSRKGLIGLVRGDCRGPRSC